MLNYQTKLLRKATAIKTRLFTLMVVFATGGFFGISANGIVVDTACAYGSFLINERSEKYPVVLKTYSDYKDFIYEMDLTDVHSPLPGYERFEVYWRPDCCLGLSESEFNNKLLIGFRTHKVARILDVVLDNGKIVVNYIREMDSLYLGHNWIAPDGTLMLAMGVTVFSISSDNIDLKDYEIKFNEKIPTNIKNLPEMRPVQNKPLSESSCYNLRGIRLPHNRVRGVYIHVNNGFLKRKLILTKKYN